jgi:eukaryotic-like serine/threonine-protein kinase
VIDIGTTLKERFLLQKELGHGGMGAVYSAIDQTLQRNVAIKVLKERSGDEVARKLRLEAQIAARLDHDNVVRIYDFGEADGISFMVMEEVNGTSYSKRWRHLAMEERLRVLAQVAEALDYAHHQGVVHRDIKPGNVLLTAADSPKLSDFGLSILAEQGDDSGIIRGTPLYMSPEQTRGVALDFRSDLYSLGVMIYESTTGTAPFGGTSTSIMSQHASSVPNPPRGRNPWISEDLEALILSLLAKRPDDRPRSGTTVAESLRREIDRLVRDRPGGAPASSGMTATRVSSAVAAPPIPPGTELGTPSEPGAAAVNGSAAGSDPGSSSSRSVPTPVDEADRTMASTIGSRPAAVPPGPKAASASVPAPAPVARPTTSISAATGGLTVMVRSPLVRRMLETVLADPILLSPEERYLSGHYLAYLLSGSRRKGMFMRRPMEPRNADRARLLLGVTYAILAGSTEEAIRDAAALLDQRIDVRAALSPVVVAKYLAERGSPARRRMFRQTRKAIAQASPYAQKRMIDAKGVLNPGLMPQKLDDLHHIAPPRTEVDDVLVERWNRVAEVWRIEPQFRHAVLRYATTGAYRDPASSSLWPEVVYPLIERARWHRRVRTRTEAVWDYLCARVLHVPDAGVQLDRALHRNVPAPLVAQLDDSLDLLVDSPRLEDEEGDPFAPVDDDDRLAASITVDPVSLEEIASESNPASRDRSVVRLVDLNPLRFLQGELHELWKEAVTALQQAQLRPGAKPPTHRHVPVGPYRLAVIPSIRGRSAGQVVIQGMAQKQIELVTPTVRTKGSAGKPLVAIWVYDDHSLVIAHLDFMGSEKFVLWHAPKSHQINFDDPAELNHELFSLGMEVPDQLDKVLSRGFKPRKTV